MTRTSFFRSLALLLALAMAAPLPVLANDEPAVPPLDTSKVKPLAEVLAQARRYVQGKIIDVELESEVDVEDGHHFARWVYEIEVLTAANHVVEMEFDAYSGLLLEIEGADWPAGVPRPKP